MFSIFQSVYFIFFALANSAKMFFLIILIPHGLSAIRVYRIKCSTCEFCEIQWPRPPLFSPSLPIQWSMGEGSYMTLFSPSDVTALHRMKYGGEGGGGYYITFFSPSDVTECCETQWRHRKPFWTNTRWKQCYIIPPPPCFIVSDSSVKTLQVKAIEFHRSSPCKCPLKGHAKAKIIK